MTDFLLTQQQSSYYLSDAVINAASKDPEIRKDIIKFEYKLLSVYAHKFSLIVIPNEKEWHGLISIAYGLYSPGKFKFKIIFPKNFPQTIPKLRLLHPLTHPLIDAEGYIDVDALIPKWKYGQDCMLYNLLQKFYEMFIDCRYFELENSYNPEASQLFTQDLNIYNAKVKKDVEQQNSILYQKQQDFELVLDPPTDSTRKMIEKVGEINSEKNLNLQQKTQQLLELFINNNKNIN